MFLTTFCNKCNAKISFWTWSEDRVKLAMKHGNLISKECSKCKVKEEYHVNNFLAVPNYFMIALGVLILIFGTIFLAILVKDSILKVNEPSNILAFATILTLPSVIFSLILRDDKIKRKAFNDVFIK